MSRKRNRDFEGVDRLDNIEEPIPKASLHVAVTRLSPVKKGRNSKYFDGQLTDGDTEIRMVGFSPELEKKLSTYKQEKRPIKLEDCEIKQSRQGHKMEVILKNSTKITESPKDINVPEDTDESPVLTTLINLPSLLNFQQIVTTIKVIQTPDPMTVTGGKCKQDVIIADDTATAKVTLWEQYVGALQLGNSYMLKNFVIREYNQLKYLSMPREGAEILSVEDVGDVYELSSDSSSEEQQEMLINNAQIVAKLALDAKQGWNLYLLLLGVALNQTA